MILLGECSFAEEFTKTEFVDHIEESINVTFTPQIVHGLLSDMNTFSVTENTVVTTNGGTQTVPVTNNFNINGTKLPSVEITDTYALSGKITWTVMDVTENNSGSDSSLFTRIKTMTVDTYVSFS